MPAAPEEEWNKLLLDGITLGKGEVSPDELYAAIKKRTERTLIRTVRTTLKFFITEMSTASFSIISTLILSRSLAQEGGSYQQRILTEYLKGIQSRAEEIVRVLQGNPQ